MEKCKKCKKRFDLRKNLEKHMLDEHGELNLKCDICNKSFLHNSTLTIHRRIHTGEKPFECDICGKRFSQKNNMISHKRTHTGEKSYKCNICHAKFKTSRVLNQHKLIHSDVKPQHCELCSKTFRQLAHKIRHERKEHNRPKLKCTWDGCQSEFNSACGLSYHTKTKHDSTPYHCDQCNRKYKLKRELDHHKRKHQIVKTRKLLAQKSQ